MNLKALHNISYGLYVVSSRRGDRFNGQITNTVIQVTSEPPTVAVCINRQNLTHEFMTQSGVFTVSMLSRDTPLSFIGHFGFKSGREVDKFKDVSYRLGETKAPVVLDNSLAFLEARVVNQVDVGTNTIFIGELVGADVLKEGDSSIITALVLVEPTSTPR